MLAGLHSTYDRMTTRHASIVSAVRVTIRADSVVVVVVEQPEYILSVFNLTRTADTRSHTTMY